MFYKHYDETLLWLIGIVDGGHSYKFQFAVVSVDQLSLELLLFQKIDTNVSSSPAVSRTQLFGAESENEPNGHWFSVFLSI